MSHDPAPEVSAGDVFYFVWFLVLAAIGGMMCLFCIIFSIKVATNGWMIFAAFFCLGVMIAGIAQARHIWREGVWRAHGLGR